MIKTLKDVEPISAEAEAIRFVNTYMVKSLKWNFIKEYKNGRPLRDLLEMTYDKDIHSIYEYKGSLIICDIPSKEIEYFLRGMQINHENCSVSTTHDLNHATINNIKEFIGDFEYDNPIFPR